MLNEKAQRWATATLLDLSLLVEDLFLTEERAMSGTMVTHVAKTLLMESHRTGLMF